MGLRLRWLLGRLLGLRLLGGLLRRLLGGLLGGLGLLPGGDGGDVA